MDTNRVCDWAGSVVTNDIRDCVVAAGTAYRVLRDIQDGDNMQTIEKTEQGR